MDRREAILRELNLYPLWKRRGQPVSVESEELLAGHPAEQHAHALPADEKLLSGHPTEAIIPTVAALAPSVEPAVFRKPSKPVSGVGNLSWPELKQQVRDCTACRLRAGCTQTVFGVGDEKAEWLFVGEGPGEDEDALGVPFVGQAGKLLDNMLAAIKLKRGKNVYIANVVKCRPPDNRSPAADEIAQCLPYLERQIALIQPKLIVALGKTAATALLGKDATIASLRGTLHDCNGIPLIVTYHPAYLLRSPTEKAKAWQDLCFAVETMQKA
jgi:uracil-DNA glycosylase family 4